MNVSVAGSQRAVVFTTRPEFTPASRSVRPKHPSWPASCMASSCLRCSGPPRATTVPAKRLNCTVNLIQNPGPCSGACLASSRCARKKRSGLSLMSVNRSMPDFVSAQEGGAVLVGDAFGAQVGDAGGEGGCPGPILGVARRKPAVHRGKGLHRARSSCARGVCKRNKTFQLALFGAFPSQHVFSSRVKFLGPEPWFGPVSVRPKLRGAPLDTWNFQRFDRPSALDSVPASSPEPLAAKAARALRRTCAGLHRRGRASSNPRSTRRRRSRRERRGARGRSGGTRRGGLARLAGEIVTWQHAPAGEDGRILRCRRVAVEAVDRGALRTVSIAA